MKTIAKTMMAVAVLSASFPSFASMRYSCHRYVGGEWQDATYVSANSKNEAEAKALQKYHDMGYKVDYVECK